MNSYKKLTISGLLLAGIALTGCAQEVPEHDGTHDPSLAVVQTENTADEKKVTPVDTKKTDNKESERHQKEVDEGLGEVNANPLTVDPSTVEVPASVENAFGEGATETLVMEALKFEQKADGFIQLQQPGRERSATDVQYLKQLEPMMTPDAYETMKSEYFGKGTALFPYLVQVPGEPTGLEVDGELYELKAGGFHFKYGAPIVDLDTSTAPDTARVTNRATIEIPTKDGGVVTINQIRSYNFIPAPDGQWLLSGWNIDTKMSAE